MKLYKCTACKREQATYHDEAVVTTTEADVAVHAAETALADRAAEAFLVDIGWTRDGEDRYCPFCAVKRRAKTKEKTPPHFYQLTGQPMTGRIDLWPTPNPKFGPKLDCEPRAFAYVGYLRCGHASYRGLEPAIEERSDRIALAKNLAAVLIEGGHVERISREAFDAIEIVTCDCRREGDEADA